MSGAGHVETEIRSNRVGNNHFWGDVNVMRIPRTPRRDKLNYGIANRHRCVPEHILDLLGFFFADNPGYL